MATFFNDVGRADAVAMPVGAPRCVRPRCRRPGRGVVREAERILDPVDRTNLRAEIAREVLAEIGSADEDDRHLVVAGSDFEKRLDDVLGVEDVLLDDVEVVDDEHPLPAVERVERSRRRRSDGAAVLTSATARCVGSIEDELEGRNRLRIGRARRSRSRSCVRSCDRPVVLVGDDRVDLDVFDAWSGTLAAAQALSRGAPRRARNSQCRNCQRPTKTQRPTPQHPHPEAWHLAQLGKCIGSWALGVMKTPVRLRTGTRRLS